jgi:hypothetical protein
MTAFAIVSFLIYSAFCWWVVFLDGAEILEGWKVSLVFDWAAGVLTASELRVGVAISWFAALIIGLVSYF